MRQCSQQTTGSSQYTLGQDNKRWIITTFSGNETVNNVVRLSTSSTGTLYTVPADKYAKVYVEKVTLGASASFTLGELIFTTGGGGSAVISSFSKTTAGSILGTTETLGEVVLYTGQTISQSTGNTVRITIIEFAIP